MKSLHSTLALLMIIIFSACSTTKNTDSFPVKRDSPVLYNNTWELEYITGPRIAFEGLFPDKKPELNFNATGNTVTGNAGCNGYSSVFTKDGDKISFSDPGPATLMYCGEGEPQFLKMMKQVNRFSIDTDGKLNLMMDDVTLMRFHKQ